MSDCGISSRVTFVNRLLGPGDSWPTARALLGDFCTAFGARTAGLRWPADGPAVLLAETGPSPHPAFQAPVPIPQMPAGLFWADGVSGDDDLLALTANALGHAPALRRFLGPVVDQARIAQRLDDAAKVAGRVAHDLDNVFQGVTGFNALALELLGPESLAHQNLKEADGAARQGMKFCAQLHQLSRGGHARPLPAGVAAALRAKSAGRSPPSRPCGSNSKRRPTCPRSRSKGAGFSSSSAICSITRPKRPRRTGRSA